VPFLTAFDARHRGGMAAFLVSHRAGVAALAGCVAASAWFGSVGMASGVLPVESRVASRLPFASPVFAAIALAVVVAIPTTIATWATLRRSPAAAPAVGVSGLLLVGWIAVELAVLREFSPLQVICAVAGAALVAVAAPAGRTS
jgi:hypothetical protein